MELLSLPAFFIAAPAVVFAAISKSGFGSGVSFASASILVIFFEPGVALGLMLPLMMLMDLGSLPAYWRKWDWQASRVLMLGALPGILLGALFYAWFNPDVLRFLIGVVSLAFVAWQLARKYRLLDLAEARFGQRTGFVAGTFLGFTSFISHAGGPAAAVYLLGQGLSKTTYQASTILVFWAVNLLKSGFYAGMDIFTRETLLMDLALAPFALLGTWLGIKAHRMVPEGPFFAITYVALTMTGMKLIYDALT